MLKQIILATFLLTSVITPTIHSFTHNSTNQSSNQLQQKATTKQHSTPHSVRSVHQYRPTHLIPLTPGKKHKHTDPADLHSYIDIKINPIQSGDHFFSYYFYLKGKLIKASDKKLYAISTNGKPNPISKLKEDEKADLFIDSDDFKNIQIKLDIGGQNELQKITNLGLDPKVMSVIQTQEQHGEINYQSVKFSIRVYGIAVSPHANFYINYMTVGNGNNYYKTAGGFDVYNMDTATRHWWMTGWGIALIIILAVIVIFLAEYFLNIFFAEAGSLVFESISGLIRVALTVAKSALVPTMTVSFLVAGLITVCGGFMTDTNFWDYTLPHLFNQDSTAKHPQNTDPNAPNYHRYINFGDFTKALFPHIDSNLVPWNNKFSKIFEQFFKNRNPYTNNPKQTNHYFFNGLCGNYNQKKYKNNFPNKYQWPNPANPFNI